MLPNRFDLNAIIPEEILDAHPAWMCAYDEETLPGQDESTIKPNDLGEPNLPGYVSTHVAFADGTSARALLGGDMGVTIADDLEDMRLYFDGTVWSFNVGPEICRQEWPNDPQFFEKYARLLPMRLTARLNAAFGPDFEDIVITVAADGAVTV